MKPTKTINKDFARRVACAYEEMKHAPNNKEVKKAYRALAIETESQFFNLPHWLTVDFDSKESHYSKPSDAIRDIQENSHLYVTPTDGNFGSDKEFNAAGNPLLAKSGAYISGKRALINDLFRVVHDFHGHYRGKNGFRALGEENAFRYHCGMFSAEAQKALTTETRGQNSWLNFGPYGEMNRKASQENTIFADQKTGLLPAWCGKEY